MGSPLEEKKERRIEDETRRRKRQVSTRAEKGVEKQQEKGGKEYRLTFPLTTRGIKLHLVVETQSQLWHATKF